MGMMEIPLQSPDFMAAGFICAGAIVIMGILFIFSLIKARVFE